MSKEIVLKSLTLNNFKGIKDLKIDFSQVTNIYGDNGTGKTTINDAFCWLLFDKDSKDRKDFEIKTLALDGQTIHGLDHTVIGLLEVNGKTVTLQKIYREKWTKKRGEAERELTGHETLYYIDDVPVKKSEYQEKISSMIDENIFKLITNPLFFSTGMKWQDRRKVLLDIIGDITSDRIIGYKANLKPLESLLVDKDIDTLKKSIQARKKKLNDDIKSIPVRIDELNNAIVKEDFEALEGQKREVQEKIKTLEEQIIDSSKIGEEVLKQKDKLYELKSKLKNIEFKAKLEAEKPFEELKTELQHVNADISNYKFKITTLENKKENSTKYKNMLLAEMDELRNQWKQINEEILQFKEDEFICPTCKRVFEADDIEKKKQEMTENFNSRKAKSLADINSKGSAKKKAVEKLDLEINELEEEITSLNAKLTELEDRKKDLEFKHFNFEPQLNFDSNIEYQDVKKQIEELEVVLQQPSVETNVSTLKAEKVGLETELELINKKLAAKDKNESIKTRIQQLLKQERDLAEQIAELEGQEYLCEEYLKTKVELLESSINAKFKYVNFKLFETQVNGGINECCEALINGVPFSNANTASQINAGIDIINALCQQYSVQAPIFIDNRESVNEIIECNSQLINLIVSNDKTLKVEVM